MGSLFVHGLMFQLMLSLSPKACGRCDDVIPEGSTYGRMGYTNWCRECIAYLEEHPHSEP